ncbi:hypothetical protein CEXT_771001 [Caerostris extrusa]|uniref:Uncharacterized protein n=1 Tax=Caerostris extrusa TaxID=172846 RepID=A0AAV4RTZ1_CAEEX|nr:hypothetical protein CEXT_771001 [Caerostris extrusa]
MPENNNVRFIRKQHDLRMQGMHHSEGRLIYKGVFSGGIHYKTFRRRANKGAKMGRGQINQAFGASFLSSRWQTTRSYFSADDSHFPPEDVTSELVTCRNSIKAGTGEDENRYCNRLTRLSKTSSLLTKSIFDNAFLGRERLGPRVIIT